MSGEDLEQPQVIVIELVQAELGDDDDPDDPRPERQRDGE